MSPAVVLFSHKGYLEKKKGKNCTSINIGGSVIPNADFSM